MKKVWLKNKRDTNQVYISLPALVIDYCLNLRIKRYFSTEYLQSKKEINIGNTKIIGSIPLGLSNVVLSRKSPLISSGNPQTNFQISQKTFLM